VRFEWDAEKAARNERLHGVSFEEAAKLFTAAAWYSSCGPSEPTR
jgi:uncharacterized DUF497 family protein